MQQFYIHFFNTLGLLKRFVSSCGKNFFLLLCLVQFVQATHQAQAQNQSENQSETQDQFQTQTQAKTKTQKKQKQKTTETQSSLHKQKHDSVSTQASKWNGWIVQKITMEGLKRIEADAIIEKIDTKKGEAFQVLKARTDIKKIFEMGFFDSIDVFVEPLENKTLHLLYELKERPAIAEIEFAGNEQIETKELKDVIKVQQWSLLDQNKVQEDVDKLQKFYLEKGFYLAKISYRIIPIKDEVDQVKLVYSIKDFEKVRVKKITFLNNKAFDDAQLRTVFQETTEGGFSAFAGDGNFKESSFKTDLQRLTYWYLDHGYVQFRYETPSVTVSEDKKWLFVSVYVDEGKEYRIKNIDFSGDLLFSTEEFRKGLKLTEGKLFKISDRNADIQKLTEMYQDLGYAFVNVIPKMNINDEDQTIDISYQFEKGKLVYFGEINVVGNAKTHDKVIRRELRVYEGQLYHGSNLRISRERVERLGYFEPGQVVFNTLTRKGHDDLVDLEISVKERSTGTVTVGAGYGSVQKFFLTAQVSEINFLGRGQNLSFQAQFANDRQSKSFNLGFTEPYFLDSKWSTGFDAFYVTFPIPDKYVMRKTGFDIRLGYPITDWTNAYITYKNETLKTLETRDSSVDTSLDEGLLSSVVWKVVRDNRNNRFETSSGSYQSVSLETAGIGGDKKFVKWILNNRLYFNVIGDLVFRNSTEYGHMTRITDRDTPPAERFYLGGPNNLRGYQFFSIGPKNLLSSGVYEPSGGVVEMYSLTELEHPLIPKAGLKWVLFFDAGNAFSDFPGIENSPFTIRTDWGFGFRWFSPIGPLRFEWGFPFAQKKGEDSPVFQFFIGPPF